MKQDYSFFPSTYHLEVIKTSKIQNELRFRDDRTDSDDTEQKQSDSIGTEYRTKSVVLVNSPQCCPFGFVNDRFVFKWSTRKILLSNTVVYKTFLTISLVVSKTLL